MIIDLSNPAQPMPVGDYHTGGSALDVAVSGKYAYVADGTAGVQRLDIRNPLVPTWVGGYHTGGFATGADVSGDFIYVTDGQRGLTVLELMPLRIGCQLGQLEMTWPMTTMNWELYSATELNPAEWIRVSGEPTLADGNCRITLPHPNESSRFFCLKAGGKSAE
jgi:hypothetical protein